MCEDILPETETLTETQLLLDLRILQMAYPVHKL